MTLRRRGGDSSRPAILRRLPRLRPASLVRLVTVFGLFSVTLAPKDDVYRSTGRCFRHRDSGHGKLVNVRITVLGCSGSVVGPDSPASGYLLTAPDTPPLVIDFGGGVLGALQRHADPSSVHVLLSHLHADRKSVV